MRWTLPFMLVPYTCVVIEGLGNPTGDDASRMIDVGRHASAMGESVRAVSVIPVSDNALTVPPLLAASTALAFPSI